MSFVIARRAVVVAALSLVSAGLATAPALAHGPSRQKVVEKIEIDAPADKVWAIVGNFQDMSWHPAVAKTEGTGGNDVGAKRTLTLKDGGKIEESVTKYDAAGKSLQYKIDNVDVGGEFTGHCGRWEVESWFGGDGEPRRRGIGPERRGELHPQRRGEAEGAE